ncbi:MAG: hypothetical protein V4506_09240 [Bacteroidota bacterium]
MITKKIIASVFLVSSLNALFAQLDFKQHPFPPTVLMSSLLENGLKMEPDYKAPYVYLPEIVFLPTKTTDGQPIDFSNSKELEFDIRQGNKVVTRTYYTKINDGMPVTALAKSDFAESEEAQSPLEAGNYTCEMMISQKIIFSMPFEVIVVKNPDPYAAVKEYRMIDGYWSKYAYYKFNKEGNMIWNVFTNNLDKKPIESLQDNKEFKMEIQLFYNDKAISQIIKENFSQTRGSWVNHDHTFPKLVGNDYISKADLKDGKYVVKVKLNEEAREYSFTIKDGAMLLIDEQDKTKTTDATKVFEGMNKEFWVKRSK